MRKSFSHMLVYISGRIDLLLKIFEYVHEKLSNIEIPCLTVKTIIFCNNFFLYYFLFFSLLYIYIINLEELDIGHITTKNIQYLSIFSYCTRKISL